jgi:hypothetical protein
VLEKIQLITQTNIAEKVSGGNRDAVQTWKLAHVPLDLKQVIPISPVSVPRILQKTARLVH